MEIPPPRSLWRDKTVLFSVHGFNVGQDSAVDTYREINAMHPMPAPLPGNQGSLDVHVGVLWPGDHQWLRAASYPSEARDADATATRFAEFITDYVSPTATIYFLAHSLGSRVVMAMLKRLDEMKNRRLPVPEVAEVCLMAAALDNDGLSIPGAKGYRKATQSTERVSVIASKNDWVLKFVFLPGDAGQWLFGPSAERVRPALGRHGINEQVKHWDQNIRDHGQSRVLPDEPEVGHGDYLPTSTASASKRKKQDQNIRRALTVLAGADI